ncbi:29244_t:CDS:2, partial [Racocetra persica]
ADEPWGRTNLKHPSIFTTSGNYGKQAVLPYRPNTPPLNSDHRREHPWNKKKLISIRDSPGQTGTPEKNITTERNTENDGNTRALLLRFLEFCKEKQKPESLRLKTSLNDEAPMDFPAYHKKFFGSR